MPTMRKILLLLALLTTSWTVAQELPRFAYNSFEGWIYTNPGLELTSENIRQARIRLYVDSQGQVLSLISPDFSCQGLDSIHADVVWRSASPSVILTIALDDTTSVPLDSVACLPPSNSHDLEFSVSIPVPQGLTMARLRFVSWNADASTSGAVKRIILTGIEGQPSAVMLGDVDGNGIINVNDVTSLISILLSGNTDFQLEAADIDKNGRITVNDVTALINLALSRN